MVTQALVLASARPTATPCLRITVVDGRCLCVLSVTHVVSFHITPATTAVAVAASQAPTLQRYESDDLGPECAICMRSIAISCVGGSCAHHFCAACLLEYSASQRDAALSPEEIRRDCPKCRAPIVSLILDPEYDVLCGADSRRPDDLRRFTASMRLARGQHAGITLRSTPDKFGVVRTRWNSHGATSQVHAHSHHLMFCPSRCSAHRAHQAPRRRVCSGASRGRRTHLCQRDHMPWARGDGRAH